MNFENAVQLMALPEDRAQWNFPLILDKKAKNREEELQHPEKMLAYYIVLYVFAVHVMASEQSTADKKAAWNEVQNVIAATKARDLVEEITREEKIIKAVIIQRDSALEKFKHKEQPSRTLIIPRKKFIPHLAFIAPVYSQSSAELNQKKKFDAEIKPHENRVKQLQNLQCIKEQAFQAAEKAEQSLKIAAFKKIYQSICAGSGKEKLAASMDHALFIYLHETQGRIDINSLGQFIAKEYREEKSIIAITEQAIKLAKKHFLNLGSNNLTLVQDMYDTAYAHSGFFKQSYATGTWFFQAKKVHEHAKNITSAMINHRKGTDTRLGRILQIVDDRSGGEKAGLNMEMVVRRSSSSSAA